MDTLTLSALLGTTVGLVISLTGAGGGVLAVPLLVFGLNLSVQEAAPLSLLAVGAAALTGAVLGWRERILRYRAAALMGGMAMLTAPLGVWLAQRLPTAPLLIGFALVLLWTAWRMAGLHWGDGPPPEPLRQPCQINPGEGRLRWTAPCAWALGATGLLSGLMTGLLGVGGGFVIVPALTRFTDLEMRSIAATSMAVISLAALGGLVAASGHGTVNGPVALSFGGAAVLALLAGRQLARRLPARTLQRAFAAVSVVVAGLMLARAAGWQLH